MRNTKTPANSGTAKRVRQLYGRGVCGIAKTDLTKEILLRIQLVNRMVSAGLRVAAEVFQAKIRNQLTV